MSDIKFRVSVDTGDAKQELVGLETAERRAADGAEDLDKAGKGAAQSTNKVGNAAAEAQRLLGQLAATIGAGFTFTELVQAAAQLETIRSGLQAVTGSAEQASREFEFIRQVATRAGADVGDVGKAFLGLAAATRGTAVEGEPTRRVFEAVATAMGKAGKSSAETQNALVALAQIASKGTVSMEELRGQLGEALPGALQAAANGLGITTKDLIELVEQGNVAAEDLFPALAKGLNELYAGGGQGAQTLAQEFANVRNAFLQLADSIGQSGGLDALKGGAEVAQAAIVLLDDALITTGKTIGTIAGAVASLDFSQLTDAFARIEAESRDKLLKAAGHNQVLANYVGLVGNESTKAALAQQQQAAATKAAGDAAAASGPTWTKLASDYGKVTTEVTKQIEQADKSRIAREAEGKAAVQLAQAFGNEQQQRDAAATAAENDARALEKLASLRLTDLNVLKAQLEAQRALIAQTGQDSEQRRKQIEDLTKQIELRQAAADSAVAQAQAARIAAEQAKAESVANQDNAARVNELRAAYEQKRVELERVRQQQAAGLATTEQVRQAELALGQATLLYRDALRDKVAALNAQADAQRAGFTLQEQLIRLTIEEQRGILEVARARGDDVAAARAQNEIRRLEIELLLLTAEAKRAEAKAGLALVEAKRAELEASGQLTAAKRAELDAQQKAAQVKEVEARIAETTARKLEDLSRVTTASGQSAAGAAGGFNTLADSVARVGDNAVTAADQLRAMRLAGQNAVDATGGFTLRDKLNAGTLSLADKALVEGQLKAAQQNMLLTQGAGAGAVSFNGWQSMQQQLVEAQRAMEIIRSMESRQNLSAQGVNPPQRGSVVNVSLGNTRTSVAVAGPQDASRLVNILGQLEDARSRAAA